MANVRDFQNKKMAGAAAGTVQYGNDAIIEPGVLETSNDLIFGAAVKLGTPVKNTKHYELVTTGDSDADVIGFLVRNVARGKVFEQQPGQVLTKVDVDTLRKGVISVVVAAGIPTIGGSIFIIDAVGDSGLNAGDFVTTATVGTGTTIAISPSFAIFDSEKEDFQSTAFIRVKTYR